MIKRIIVVIFAGVLLVTSAVALAVSNETLNASNKFVGIINNVAGASIQKQKESIESSTVAYSILQAVNNDETTLPVNGWLLTVALFGFVLLSNRAGV